MNAITTTAQGAKVKKTYKSPNYLNYWNMDNFRYLSMVSYNRDNVTTLYYDVADLNDKVITYSIHL